MDCHESEILKAHIREVNELNQALEEIINAASEPTEKKQDAKSGGSMVKRSAKKGRDRFERKLREIDDIANMLKKEGKSDGECSHFIFMATLLLMIGESLRRIGLALFCLLGFIVGKIISGLF